MDISVPTATALPFAEAVEAIGPAETEITGIVLGAIVESVLAAHAQAGDVALLLDSDLTVEGEDCSVSFLLAPDRGGVDELLARLGLG